MLRICLVGENDAADDVIEATAAAGNGRIALLLRSLAELLDQLGGTQVHIDSNGTPGPVLITDVGDADFLALDMPCAWPKAQEAT